MSAEEIGPRPAQAGTGAGADAANASAEGQPADVTPTDPAAAEREREERESSERQALYKELDALHSELAAERAARLRAESALGAQVETLSAAPSQAPPSVLTARLGLSLTGYAQTDLSFRQSSQNQLTPAGAPLNQDLFLIRRARIRAAVERWWVAGAVEFDGNTVNGPAARILGVEASLKWPPERGAPPLLMATIGGFKIPFGFEVGQSDRERLFLERSTAEKGLFPGEYDLGARLMGGWRFVRYAIAVQNGEPVGERTGFPYRDPNAQKDVSGRLGIETPITTRVWVAGGFSGLSGTGFHPGTPATKSVIQWNDRNGDGALESNEIVVIPASAASPSQNFPRFGFGGDLRLGVDTGGLGQTVAYAETYWAKNLDRAILIADPVSFGRDLREFGVYVGVTQELGPHAQVGVRWDFYNPDADSVNQVMGAATPTAFAYQTLAFAAALRGASGRLIAELDINRNQLGRDAEGAPVNLPDNAFTVRGEISF